MDGDASQSDQSVRSVLIPIGALARLTGLSVRTLRFYSDRGLLAPADRSEARPRLYDAGAAARTELVRTLRELGVDLPTIRRVLDRELSIAVRGATEAPGSDAEREAHARRHDADVHRPPRRALLGAAGDHERLAPARGIGCASLGMAPGGVAPDRPA